MAFKILEEPNFYTNVNESESVKVIQYYAA